MPSLPLPSCVSQALRDIERLSEKVATLTNTSLDKTTELLHGPYYDSCKQWFNKAERSATGDTRQASRILDTARVHASARATEYRAQSQDAEEMPGTRNQDPVASVTSPAAPSPPLNQSHPPSICAMSPPMDNTPKAPAATPSKVTKAQALAQTEAAHAGSPHKPRTCLLGRRKTAG